MAARFLLCIILLFLLGSCIESISPHHQRPAERLFVFGDSYADTGNIARGLANCWKPPYGSTFPGKPAGRFSDGRVITDFIATFLGVPSPVPYRLRRVAGHRGSYGINFAYSGTGVFDTSAPLPNVTTQIDYLEQMIKEGWYEKRQVRSSMAFLALAGIDYLEFLLYKNGTLEDQGSRIHSASAAWEPRREAIAATPITVGNRCTVYVRIQEDGFSGTMAIQLRLHGPPFSKLSALLFINYSHSNCALSEEF
ncbi:GDSL esterase/lipase At5g03610-like isoform X2 [Nymphaea colorata]|uniref:GDSL esterase/lipase At5g03610-like isoform X2 n=1 Tax=Nymphaea colorata TaxID=210225 RepID=UPI00129DA7C9|nr:GDSL esterase/lipase At5g03610-like isoform X2 [Nymphaea colorata]